jgi:hypothetical protein
MVTQRGRGYRWKIRAALEAHHAIFPLMWIAVDSLGIISAIHMPWDFHYPGNRHVLVCYFQLSVIT